MAVVGVTPTPRWTWSIPVTTRAAGRLHVQQHAREEYQAVHVSGPLVRLAAVLHGRRVLSCKHLRHGSVNIQNLWVSPTIDGLWPRHGETVTKDGREIEISDRKRLGKMCVVQSVMKKI